MAVIDSQPHVIVFLSLKLNEMEARALNDIASYGTPKFLEMFYKHLGESYLKKHEEGLKTLFEAAREQIPPILARADEARKAFEKGKT